MEKLSRMAFEISNVMIDHNSGEASTLSLFELPKLSSGKLEST